MLLCFCIYNHSTASCLNLDHNFSTKVLLITCIALTIAFVPELCPKFITLSRRSTAILLFRTTKINSTEQGSGNMVVGSWDSGSDVSLWALKSLKYGQANCLRLLVLTLCQLLGICKCKSQESIWILWSLLTLWFHFWAFKSILHLKALRISCSLFQFNWSWWLDGFYLLGAKSSLILRILWRSTHLSWLVLDRFENFEVF